MLDEDICQCGKHRAARLWRRIAPCRKRLRGCRNSPVDVSGGGIGHFGGNSLVAGVYDLHGARAVHQRAVDEHLDHFILFGRSVLCKEFCMVGKTAAHLAALASSNSYNTSGSSPVTSEMMLTHI